MIWNVYLSGEIHTDWRNEIKKHAQKEKLNIKFTEPVTNHEYSDDCGVVLTGPEEKKFWHDHKGANINAIRTRTYIEKSDIVVVRFGDKYKQWNAAFDAGYASALKKSIIIIHGDEHQHALKEVDAAALAVVNEPSKIVDILKYVINSELQ
tara:strand:- start:5285 stop:5737 length:453 start_codon:yes stop_codon:yes gene_type:complete